MMDEYQKAHIAFIQNAVNKAAIMAANWRACRSTAHAKIAAVLCRNSKLIYGAEEHILHTAVKVAESIGSRRTAILEKRMGKTGSIRKRTNNIYEILKFLRHNAAWVEDSLGCNGCCWRNKSGEWCGIYFE